MWIRSTLLCAAIAALTACSGFAPTNDAQAPAASAQATYPSEHNQFRELGWE